MRNLQIRLYKADLCIISLCNKRKLFLFAYNCKSLNTMVILINRTHCSIRNGYELNKYWFIKLVYCNSICFHYYESNVIWRATATKKSRDFPTLARAFVFPVAECTIYLTSGVMLLGEHSPVYSYGGVAATVDIICTVDAVVQLYLLHRVTMHTAYKLLNIYIEISNYSLQ